MPLLPKEGYNAQLGGLPIAGGRAPDMNDPMAEAVRGFAGTAAKVADSLLQHTEEKEARTALVETSEVRAKYARELDTATKTGAPLEPIKEKMNADLAKIGEGFQTKKGASSLQHYASNTTLMFDEQANSIGVQRAFASAKVDAQKLLVNSSSIIATNPGYLPVAEENVDALVSTFGGIRADQRATIAAELKQELNLAAAVSAARSDPKGTLKRLQNGEWNLTSQQREHATNRATQEINAERTEQAYLDAQAAKKRAEENEDSWSAHSKAILNGDLGTSIRRRIMDDPSLKPQTREHLIAMMEIRTREITHGEKKSDPVTYRDLWLAINAQEGDPNKIYTGERVREAVALGKLNVADADRLNTQIANQRDENGRTLGMKISGYSSIVGRAIASDPKYTGRPDLVAEIQNIYNARVEDRIAQLRMAGDKQPMRVFDEKDKDWVGSAAFVQGAVAAAQERQRAAQPKPPVVNSQADYDALDASKGDVVYVDSNGTQAVKRRGTKSKTADAPQGPTVTGNISDVAAP